MSVASIKAGRAFYEVFAEDKTSEGLTSAEQALMRFGARIGAVGASMAAFAAAGLGSLTGMAMKFATFGDEIGDAMAKTGVSAEWLQVFDVAAQKADMSLGQIVASINKMQRGLFNGKISKGVAMIGLSLEDLKTKTPEQAFLAIGDALSKIQDPTRRAAAAIEIFGRSGAQLLPVFEDGAAGLLDTFNKLSEGALLDDKDIAAAGKLDDEIVLLKASLAQLARIIGAAVAPAVTVAVEVFSKVVRAAARFVDNNRLLVNVLGGGLLVIGAVGVALMTLGTICVAASLATTGLTMAMTALAGILAIVWSPLFVIGAAIVACGAAALTSAYYLDQLFNRGRGFAAMAQVANDAAMAVNLLAQAIMAGEWKLLGDYLAASIESAFEGVFVSLKKQWSDFLQLIGQDALNLTEDSTRASRAAIRANELGAKIFQLSQTPKRTLPNFGSGGGLAFGAASGALQEIQTNGALSSSSAARLNQSAPGNQWHEKILENSDEQTKTLAEIRDHLDDLDNLTVE